MSDAKTADKFNKGKIEKKAKELEEQMERQVTIESRSVRRAIARDRAMAELFPELSANDRYEHLFLLFYTDAAYRENWTADFEKHAKDLGQALKAKCRDPKTRAKAAAAPVTMPAGEDPEALLTPAQAQA